MLSRSAMARLRVLIGRFRRHRGGVAAIEFAFISPVLLLLMGGAIELGGAITAGNRATYVAETVGQVISQTQATLGQKDLEAILKAAVLIDPDVIAYAKATGKNIDAAADVVVSSIVFVPQKNCQNKKNNKCTYKANVVFSKGLSGTQRACGTLNSGVGDSPKLLQPDVYSANAIIEVKVTVRYRPLMTSILGRELSFARAMYFRPRYVEHVDYANNCSDYSQS